MPTTSTSSTGSTSRFGRYLNIADNASDWTLALAIVVPLLIVYVATGNINSDTQSPDPVAAALPAWHWATYHTFHLDHVFTLNPWVYQAKGHYVSNRQPGVVFFGIPFYLLLDRTPQFSMFPAVVAAATSAAGAVTFLTLAVRRALGTRIALLTAAVVAFGTATWSVSADTLWPHGPDQLFLAAALYFMARNRMFRAAIAIALAVPVRAHLAVFALIAGVWYAVERRSVKPLAVFGGPAMVSLAGVSLYNHWMFGTWSLNGGYPPYVSQNLTGLGQLSGRFSLPDNILGSLFSLDRGLVIWCPVLVVLAIGLRAAWRQSPTWVRVGAVTGVAYFLIQMKLNYFSGGDRFWSYRLTIESVTLAVPLFAYAARHVMSHRPRVARVALAAAIYGVGAQAVGAIYFKDDDRIHSAWTHSKLAQVLRDGGTAPRVMMAITVILMVAAVLWPRREANSDVDRDLPVLQPVLVD